MAGRLRVYIEGDADHLQRETRAASSSIGRLDSESTGRDGATASRAASRSTAAAGGAAAGIGLAIGSLFSITQITGAISATVDLAKSTRSLHENFGLSIKSASEWAAVAAVRGADSKKLGMAFKTLASQIASARDGSESATASFHKLGFTQAEIHEGAEHTSSLLTDVADGLKGMEGGADKAAISGKLFGRGWQTVAPILRDGSAEMERSLELANHYGATFDGEALDSLNDLIGAQRELALAQLGARVRFTEGLAPALMDAGLDIAHLVRRTLHGKGVIVEFVEVAKILLWPAIQVLKVQFFLMTKVIPFIFRIAVGAVKEFWGAIKFFVRLKEPFEGAGKIVGRFVKGLAHHVGNVARFIGRALRPLGSFLGRIAKAIAGVVGGGIDALSGAEAKLPVVSVKLPTHKGRAPVRRQRGGIVGMATGGLVGLQPGAASLARTMVSRFGGSISSGVRPGDPGFHGSGQAIDWVGGDWAGASAYVNLIGPSLAEGIHQAPPGSQVSWDSGRQVPPSFWGSATWAAHVSHIHLAVTGAVSGAATSIPRIEVRGRGPLAGMSQSVADRLRDAANAYLAKLAPSVSASSAEGTLTEGEFSRFAQQAIQITGHHEFTVGGLLTLARAESGLQVNPPPPHDSNWPDNPSMGLMQVTLDTFDAYHQRGTSNEITDPVANIAASINYQADRYGGQITFSPYQHGGIVEGDQYVEPDLDLDLEALEAQLREQFDNRAALSGDRLALAITGLAWQ